jgi:hypothetical protein
MKVPLRHGVLVNPREEMSCLVLSKDIYQENRNLGTFRTHHSSLVGRGNE